MSEKKSDLNINKYSKMIPIIIVIAMIVVVVSVITGEADSNNGVHRQSSTISNPKLPQSSSIQYDKQMVAVVKAMDTEKKSVTLLDTECNEEKILYYSGSTMIKDRYDQDITMPQIILGEVVDVYYLLDDSITACNISKDAWDYKRINHLIINNDKKMMTVGDRNFQYNENLVVAGDNKLMNLIDISDKDELTLKGIKNQIVSVTITKGHGYVRFSNYSDFIGGNLEIGNDNMIEISKDMLVVVREGDYKLTMENGSLVGSKLIHINRDQELVVDMGEFRKKAVEEGKISFTVIPEGAELYINDKIVDYSEPIKLAYGDYRINSVLTGYQTYSGKIKVEASSMQFFISLAPEKKETEGSNSNNNSNSNNGSNSNTNNSNNNSSDQSLQEEVDNSDTSKNKVDNDHQIYVQSPIGASVYWNGQLIGITPVKFTKQIGSYTISLTSDGYETASYPVVIADDDQDVYLNFPSLTSKSLLQ